jgi:hypothetical protein
MPAVPRGHWARRFPRVAEEILAGKVRGRVVVEIG